MSLQIDTKNPRRLACGGFLWCKLYFSLHMVERAKAHATLKIYGITIGVSVGVTVGVGVAVSASQPL